LKLPLGGRKKFEGVLAAREGGWRLEMAPAAKAAKGEPAPALDFVLDVVREAHLVPVVDFKGKDKARKPGKAAPAAPRQAVAAHDGE
jgi:ribosome maturation factor RimP